MEVIKLCEKKEDDFGRLYTQVEEIFFASATRQDFSFEERVEFFTDWVGNYQSHYREFFYLALEENFVLGYLTGCPDTVDALTKFQLPGMNEFQEELVTFPAHLHINCHPQSRGKGIGSLLVESFCREIQEMDVPGVHIVTGKESSNRKFYQKLGFSYVKTCDPVIFMGKSLAAEKFS